MFCSCILLFPFQPRQLVARREEEGKKKGRKRNIAVLSSLLEIHQLQAMHAKFL
jgi:hypothetical protein